jgi:catechol 2,3-dioxygenase-like lactoylglutathione lyase family enzyme
MLGQEELVAFVGCRDPDRAKAFYRDTLGLRLVAEDPFALIFDAHGAMLRVTVVPEVVVAGYTVLGWRVANIESVAAALAHAGIRPLRYKQLCQDECGIWTSPGGAKVLWFQDPDGNTLSVSQF